MTYRMHHLGSGGQVLYDGLIKLEPGFRRAGDLLMRARWCRRGTSFRAGCRAPPSDGHTLPDPQLRPMCGRLSCPLP